MKRLLSETLLCPPCLTHYFLAQTNQTLISIISFPLKKERGPFSQLSPCLAITIISHVSDTFLGILHVLTQNKTTKILLSLHLFLRIGN